MTEKPETLEGKEELNSQEQAFVRLLLAEGHLAAAKAFMEQTLTEEEIKRAQKKVREQNGE